MVNKTNEKTMGERINDSMADLLAAIREAKAAGIPIEDHPRITVRKVMVPGPPLLAPEDVKRIRSKLGVSQAVFAEMVGVSTVLVQSWEQGQRSPSAMARRLLRWIEADPEAFVAQTAA